MKEIVAVLKKLGNKIFLWYAFKLPPCKEITQTLSQSLDRPLSIRDRIFLKLHLQICELCRRYQRQLHFLRNTIREFSAAEESNEMTQPSSDSALSSEARERFKKSLSQNS